MFVYLWIPYVMLCLLCHRINNNGASSIQQPLRNMVRYVVQYVGEEAFQVSAGFEIDRFGGVDRVPSLRSINR